MDYKLLTVDDMKAELERRLKAFEASHYSSLCALIEFEALGAEYAEAAAEEKKKLAAFETIIEALKQRWDAFTTLTD